MTTRPRLTFHLPLAAFALAMIGLLTMIATPPVLAQTFNVLHTFTDGADGAYPTSGVTIGGLGTLYGTTEHGGTGTHEFGVVFKLAQRGSGWTLDPLYEFTDGSDGGGPLAPVVVGPNGALYGTTAAGGSGNQGTVFELQPPAAGCRAAFCYWNETVLHSFQGGADDGSDPNYGNLIFDRAGNMYGPPNMEEPEVGGCAPMGAERPLNCRTPSGDGPSASFIASKPMGSTGFCRSMA